MRHLARLWLGLALLLAAATPAVYRGLERYQPDPQPWLPEPAFARGPDGGLAGWRVTGDPSNAQILPDGTLRLVNRDPEGGISLDRELPLTAGGARLFRISGAIGAEAIGGGRRGFRQGEVTLVAGHDVGRFKFVGLHRLDGVRETRALEPIERTFTFAERDDKVSVGIRLRFATGALLVRDLRLEGFSERPLFGAVALALKIGWVVALGLGAIVFWRGVENRRMATALVACGAAGLFLVIMPHELRVILTERVSRDFDEILLPETIAKIGHFVVFALLAGLVRLSRPSDPRPLQLLALVAAAGLGEMLQFMADLRQPALFDWLVNAGGVVAGWLLVRLWPGVGQGQLATQTEDSETEPPQAAKQAR